VLIGGSGVRTLRWIEGLETELGVPLVSADRTLYLSVLKVMGLAENDGD
jgi:maleate cis-trans isomerase